VKSYVIGLLPIQQTSHVINVRTGLGILYVMDGSLLTTEKKTLA